MAILFLLLHWDGRVTLLFCLLGFGNVLCDRLGILSWKLKRLVRLLDLLVASFFNFIEGTDLLVFSSNHPQDAVQVVDALLDKTLLAHHGPQDGQQEQKQARV